MFEHDFDPERDRYGSAGWSDKEDIRRAGLLGSAGLPLGYFGNSILRLEGDAPLITIAGAGGGKLTTVIAFVVCNGAGTPMLICDPRGEIAAISLHTLAPANEYGYCWGPVPMHSLPQHSCNPLDVLSIDSPNFHGDCQFIMEGLVPLSSGSEGSYFPLTARRWLGDIAISRVEQHGRTSLPDLYRVITTIEADRDAWANQLEAMLSSRFENVRRTAGEMLTKQQDAPKEFGGVMGEIYAHTNFLSDPALRRALEGGDFSLSALVDPQRVSKVFLNVPADYLSLWSPVLRIFFTVTMLYKSREPAARRVLLLADEAGQMGRFEALLRAFTYGRGAGIRAWAFFQDIGQIERNYGREAVVGFLGSAQVRQFFSVRDYQTAQLVSNMLGTQTLEFDNTLDQADARRRRENLVRSVLAGGDPFEAYADFRQHEFASRHRSKQARPVLTPDEVLSLPEDRQVLFVSGKNLKPIPGERYPYFTRREMAGRYLNNPHHPPADRVRVATRFGSKWACIKEGPVPERYRDFPQYQSGVMRWIDI